MEFRQLEHAVALAEEGSFTRAADRCGIAQSGLSYSIQALERELEAPLFNRGVRPVVPTEAGRAFLSEARKALVARASARAVTSAVQGLERGSLTVGTVYSAGYWWDLPAAMARFHERYPGVEIATRTGDALTLIDLVAAGEIDAAVAGCPAALPPGLRSMDLVRAPLGVCCPADHPIALRSRVGTRAVAREPFIDLPGANLVRQATDSAFEGAGIRRHVAFEVSDAHTALGFVAEGLGMACLPRPPQLPAGVAFVPLLGWPEWTLGLLTAAPEHQSPTAGALVALTGTAGAGR